MSNALFPTLAGLGWDVQKSPEFNTQVQRSVSLAELRGSFASTPLWNFKLHYDVLRADSLNAELQRLAGFFCSRYGSWDSFLFLDPDDGAATAVPFGTGDGTTTDFQLMRAQSYFSESVSNIGTAPSIYKATVLQSSGYTVDSTGLVSFDTAPADGAALTWTGSYYFRCRFKNDMQEFNQFMRQLWEAQSVEFVGSLGVKI